LTIFHCALLMHMRDRDVLGCLVAAFTLEF
jgi:hypothetical protein